MATHAAEAQDIEARMKDAVATAERLATTMSEMSDRIWQLTRRFQLGWYRQEIGEAARMTEALARKFFGPAAYLVREVDEDRETGQEEVVFEVHYCCEDPENEFDPLAALHDEFTTEFVRAVSRDILPMVILRAVPTEES